MKTNLILGIDIGGTNMRFGLVDDQYKLSCFDIESTRIILDYENPIEKIIETIQNYCNRYLDKKIPKAISIGFPSTIDKTRRIVRTTPNIQGLENLAVADILEDRFDIPVFVNRDVNFLFLYDMYFHRLSKKTTTLGFYIGTGFGNAISIDGKLLLGKNGVAGELGHVTIFPDGDICGCGSRGCVETFASGIYLEKLQKASFPDTPIDEMFTRHKDTPELRKYVENLSLPIAAEINIFDPDYNIIGGGIIQMKDFPLEFFEDCIHEHTRKPYPEENLEILYSLPKQENGVIGAGIYAYDCLREVTVKN